MEFSFAFGARPGYGTNGLRTPLAPGSWSEGKEIYL